MPKLFERPLPQAGTCIEGELPIGSRLQVSLPQAGERRTKVYIYLQPAPCRSVDVEIGCHQLAGQVCATWWKKQTRLNESVTEVALL